MNITMTNNLAKQSLVEIKEFLSATCGLEFCQSLK